MQAFVEFENEEAAAAAVALNGGDIIGRPVKVEFSSKIPKKPMGTLASGGKRSALCFFVPSAIDQSKLTSEERGPCRRSLQTAQLCSSADLHLR